MKKQGYVHTGAARIKNKGLRRRIEQVHCRELRMRCAISPIWMHCDENRTCLHITIFVEKVLVVLVTNVLSDVTKN